MITISDIAPSIRQAEDKLPRKIKASDLLQGAKTVFIEHNGSEYKLQLTRSHKLILTK